MTPGFNSVHKMLLVPDSGKSPGQRKSKCHSGILFTKAEFSPLRKFICVDAGVGVHLCHCLVTISRLGELVDSFLLLCGSQVRNAAHQSLVASTFSLRQYLSLITI